MLLSLLLLLLLLLLFVVLTLSHRQKCVVNIILSTYDVLFSPFSQDRGDMNQRSSPPKSSALPLTEKGTDLFATPGKPPFDSRRSSSLALRPFFRRGHQGLLWWGAWDGRVAAGSRAALGSSVFSSLQYNSNRRSCEGPKNTRLPCRCLPKRTNDQY